MGWQIPTNSLDIFVRSTEIASYMPGRIRLYADGLIGNEKAAAEIKTRLGEYPELTGVDINTVSGSILITYNPAVLSRNPKLKKAEDYIKSHAKHK